MNGGRPDGLPALLLFRVFTKSRGTIERISQVEHPHPPHCARHCSSIRHCRTSCSVPHCGSTRLMCPMGTAASAAPEIGGRLYFVPMLD